MNRVAPRSKVLDSIATLATAARATDELASQQHAQLRRFILSAHKAGHSLATIATYAGVSRSRIGYLVTKYGNKP